MTWLNDATVKTAEEKSAELAEQEAAEQKRLQSEQKLSGVEFEGVMCSATAKDQWGLSSVKPDILAGASYSFHFENENVLLLTPDNLADFESVWKPFRAGFF